MSSGPVRPTPSPAARTRTRGFLFADLRGYTDFVEALGDHAAAELLASYRALVRDAVGRFEGAEVKTEGDSFYVVFDAASDAVGCGLAIVQAAAEASSANPERPIRVGVGIHAGETVETSDGFVGSAVNVAARVCALAGPGQVLVSETVRSLTRTYLDVGFLPLGIRTLKGVAEPITVFAVQPQGSGRALGPSPRRLRSRVPLWLAAAAAGTVVVGLVAVSGGLVHVPLGAASPSASASPTSIATARPTPTPLPSGVALTACNVGSEIRLGSGLYVTRCFRPTFTFRSAAGWDQYAEDPTFLLLNWVDPPTGCTVDVESPSSSCTFWVTHFTSGHRGCTPNVEPVGPGVEGLLEWLNGDTALTQVSNVSSAGALGLGAVQVEYERSNACTTDSVPLFDILGGTVTVPLGRDGHVRFMAVDVAGTTITAMIVAPAGQWPVFAAVARPVVESIRFEGD